MKNINKLIIILLSLFIFSYYVIAEETLTTTESGEVDDSVETIDNEKYTNPKTGYKVIIEDDANLLSESEEESIQIKMIEFTEYGNIVLKTTDNNSYSTSGFAEQYYHTLFGTQSGSLFLIDMDNREIFIFSDGNNFNIITSSKAYSITDNVYRYASKKDYYQCSSEAFDQMLALLKGNKIMEPMRYISNILISITSAAFLTYFFVVSKSKIKRPSNKEILSTCKVDFQIGEINAVKSGTTKEYRPVSDSSSGGHSSGGHSGGGGGGGHSGGGGGHRF
ncbi:MAG: TPM domain-containing protein [Bacilli bacterium]|nr:TPM domain-containing protein [Bacilli bacterium]